MRYVRRRDLRLQQRRSGIGPTCIDLPIRFAMLPEMCGSCPPGYWHQLIAGWSGSQLPDTGQLLHILIIPQGAAQMLASGRPMFGSGWSLV